jgi:hypothetical protein
VATHRPLIKRRTFVRFPRISPHVFPVPLLSSSFFIFRRQFVSLPII